MTGTDAPGVLEVEDLGDGRWTAAHPTEDPEKRDVIFSGQILGQMIMISAASGEGKETKSIHCIFARAGSYSGGPIEYRLESMHAGRAWASDTITAFQGERLLARSLVLSNTVEPDLMRHSAAMPDVPSPDDCAIDRSILVVFPGSEVRPVDLPDLRSPDGSPVSYRWVRAPEALDGIAANQAAIAWAEPGFTIGTAMQAHRDTVRISDSHRTISTGVISHTAHFHDHGDADEWLLVETTATFAGNGRVFGTGSVFTRGGTLVSTFGQDSMARGVDGTLDPTRSM